MDALKIIDKFYPEDNELRNILIVHSEAVGHKALEVADRHPELGLDREFLWNASMLHDIGIFMCDAPGICCTGTEPYICHGSIGSRLLEAEGLHDYALVCERHTGAGIALKDILAQQLPIPHREMLPVSLEEQVVCFADKFFSKSHLERVRTPEQALQSLLKFGEDGAERFRLWCERFL